MPDPVLTPPDTTVVTGGRMFPDEVHKQIQAAIDAKNTPPAAAPPAATPSPSEPPKTASAVPPAKPAVPPQPGTTTKPTEEPKYPRSAIQWEEWKKTERERMQKEFEDKYKSAAPAPNGEFDKIRTERDTLAKQLQLVAIERDPAFNKEFDTASAAVLASAKAASGKHADAIERVLKMAPSEARDEAIEKLMDDVPAYKQTQIGYALAEMDKLRNLKAARIQEAQANWEQLQSRSAEERKRAQETEKTEMVKVLDHTIAEWSDKEKGLPVLQKREDDESWNTQVDESIQLAKDIFGGELDIESLARASLWAASAPLLLRDNAALMEQIKAKDKELAQLKGLSPGADGQAGAPGATAPEGEIPEGTDYGRAIGMAVRRAGLNMQ